MSKFHKWLNDLTDELDDIPIRVLVIGALILAIALFVAYKVQAQMPLAPNYLRLQSDTSGLGYEYTDEFHYTNVRPMAWDDEHGLSEINGLGYLAEQWVNLSDGSLINVYVDPITNEWYTLCFGDNPAREGRIYGAHMTCGAHWVERK